MMFFIPPIYLGILIVSLLVIGGMSAIAYLFPRNPPQNRPCSTQQKEPSRKCRIH